MHYREDNWGIKNKVRLWMRKSLFQEGPLRSPENNGEKITVRSTLSQTELNMCNSLEENQGLAANWASTEW